MKYCEDGLLLRSEGPALRKWDGESQTCYVKAIEPVQLRQLLWYPIAEIYDDFTLGHFMKLIKDSGAEWWEEFLQEYVEAIVEEALSPLAQPAQESSVERLEVYAIVEAAPHALYFNYCFHGWGPYSADINGVEGSDLPLEGGYAIEFSPTNELVNLPLTFKPTAMLYQTEGTQVTNKEYPAEPIRFIEFVKAIFWELTFSGPPTERDKKAAEIQGLMQDALQQINHS